MHLKWIAHIPMLLGMALLLVASVPATAADTDDEKPYRIVDGKVDFGTYNGYRRYHNSCHRCHGPDAVGSSFAPSLICRATPGTCKAAAERIASTLISSGVMVVAAESRR